MPTPTVRVQFSRVGGPPGEVRVVPTSIFACDGSVRLGDGSVRACDGSVYIGLGDTAFDGAVANVSLAFDTDPFISFSIAAVNFTAAPAVFDFTLAIPYSGGPYAMMSSYLDGVLVEARGDAAGVSPLTLEGVLDGGIVAALTVSESCVAELGIGETADCGPYGPLSAGVTSGAAGVLEAHLAFTLSPNFDAATFGGVIELFAPASDVPAPASALLLAGALGGLARRRRR
ncbi:MAG: PEP-CTERM sorting domain-containing protein [Alphaproteobacteria bacterium]|nr:PEP-CTERM sorting domain-containing protein [Alphaproteobacteria bacterium]